MPDYSVGDTVYKRFTTRDFDTGAPQTLGGTPVVSAYEDDGTTEITAGITLGVDHDSRTGLNLLTIVATGANGYETGKSYDLVITTGTVDGVSVVGEVIWHFTLGVENIGFIGGQALTVAAGVTINAELGASATAMDNFENQYDGDGIAGDNFPATQSQVSNIQAAGSAINKTVKPSPNGFVITTGSNEVNNEDSTFPLDGVVHSIDDTAGTLDVYYEADVGAGVPASVTIHGYVNGVTDDLNVYGYDWIAAGWVQIGTWSGKAVSTVETINFNLFTAMVGTGNDRGTVRIRFQGTGLSSATLAVDQIFITFSQSSTIYDSGAVWFDSNASNTGTTAGVDGVSTNPVSTMGAVNTLLAALNLNKVMVAPGATVTLAAAQNDQFFDGVNWDLALGGQDIAGTMFHGAAVSGIAAGTGTMQMFRNCTLNAVSHIKNTHNVGCAIAGTQTMVEAGDIFFDQGRSSIAGSDTWSFDFGALIGVTNLNVRHHSGGIQLEAMGDTGADTASIEGMGQIIEGTCTGGSPSIRGLFTLSGITNLTPVDDARFDITRTFPADAIALSGDTTAADNLEATYDGTGYSNGEAPATQDQVSQIAVAGAAVNVVAESYTLTTGTQSANLYTDTAPLDQVRHEHTDAAGAMELYYQFDVGSAGVPTAAKVTGYLTTGVNALDVFAYNWAGASWDQVGSLSGGGANDAVHTYDLYTSHVGTGANLGKVRIRFFAASGLSSATLAIDQIFTSYAVIPVTRQTKGAVSDATPAALGFDTDLTEADDFWNDALIEFTSGSLTGQSKPIIDYANANGAITLDEAFTSAPSDTDAFIIYHDHIHPISQISAGVLDGLITGRGAGSLGKAVEDIESYVDGIMPAKNADLANVEFLMVLTSDHVSPATGLTITATRSIDGGAFGAKHASTTVAEVSNGIYQIDINAADLNGDIITFRFVSATADDRFLTIRTAG